MVRATRNKRSKQGILIVKLKITMMERKGRKETLKGKTERKEKECTGGGRRKEEGGGTHCGR